MIRLLFYRTYRRAFGLAYWLSRRFTAAGKLVLACLILAAVFGTDTTQSTAYQAAAFLTGVLVVAAICVSDRRWRGKFTATRRLPRLGTVGSPVTYHVTVNNLTARPQRGAVMLEDLPDPRPAWDEFVARAKHRAPGLEAWLDDVIGFSRWIQLVARRRPAVIGETLVPDVTARATVEVPVTFTPSRRGRVEFQGLTLARPEVLGLLRSFCRVPAAQSLVILPKRYRLPCLALPGDREYQPLGVALASAVGQSDEFVALRDYRPGDSLRHIHWRSVAKCDRLVVRENEDEFFVRHALILDTCATVEDDAVFEEAVAVASSFVCAIETQESLLDLLFVGPQAYTFTAGRGVGHVEQMLTVLAGVEPSAPQQFATLETLVLRHVARVSGCVCVLLVWDEPRQRLVQQLRARGLPVRVCVVTAGAREPEPGVLFLPVGQVGEALSRL